MTVVDPFGQAHCRQPNLDPAMWDVDAPTRHRHTAAAWCRTCPAITACATTAAILGDNASGTWAGTYRDWQLNKADDDVLAEYLAAFGPSPVYNDLPIPEPAGPYKVGRYWVHPSQMKFLFDHQETR